MAYDEELAQRIRVLLATERDVSERKMFGGLGFLLGGNLAIAASGQGGILVRVEPGQRARLEATTRASAAVMRGRPMRGWLRVPADGVRTKRQLARWVQVATSCVRSLPATSRAPVTKAARSPRSRPEKESARPRTGPTMPP